MRNVMKKAWEIAREGQKKFGGKVKEYFAQALRMAWEIVKNVMETVELIGSEKQVKWAESIREVIIKNTQEIKSISSDLEDQRGVDQLNNLLDHLASKETSAKFFIEIFSSLTEKSEDSEVYRLSSSLIGIGSKLPSEFRLAFRAAKKIEAIIFDREN